MPNAQIDLLVPVVQLSEDRIIGFAWPVQVPALLPRRNDPGLGISDAKD